MNHFAEVVFILLALTLFRKVNMWFATYLPCQPLLLTDVSTENLHSPEFALGWQVGLSKYVTSWSDHVF